jgi:predicted RNase H-like nuclease
MPLEITAVLGVDAAWTDGQPSGVALLERRSLRWKCMHVAPSYAGFCNGFEWSDRCIGGAVDVSAMFAACGRRLGVVNPIVVAVDMPLATTPIHGRRRADNLISRQFGHRKCSVHSPTRARPGSTGRRLQEGFIDAGYVLATTANSQVPALLEVYPHVALLGLLGYGERCPYKVSRTNPIGVARVPSTASGCWVSNGI